jgi:hypothetical protein
LGIATPEEAAECDVLRSLSYEQPAPDANKPTPTPTPAPTPGDTFTFSDNYDAHNAGVTVLERGDKIASDVDALIGQLDAKRKELFAANLRKFRDAQSPDPEGYANAATDAELKGHRKELFAKNEQRLMNAVADLQKFEREANEYAHLYCCQNEPSSVTFASLFKIGTPERAQTMAQLQGMGPRELANVAEYAVKTGNKLLVACCKTVNDQFDSKHRAISSQEICDRIWGKQAHDVWNAARTARMAVNGAMAQLRLLRSGERDPLGKITRGLMQQQTVKAPPSPTERPLGRDDSISRISRGLDEMRAE